MIQKVFGISGWKNSGKTTLVSQLVKEFSSRKLRVSTIKHAHHTFDLDQPRTDSFKHREAGASEVVLVSRNRWAIQHELRDEEEPSLHEILAKLSHCDLVLVEGYKREPIPKIEILGNETRDDEQLWVNDERVIALATDRENDACPLPQFRRDDVSKIADFISDHLVLDRS